MSRLQLFLWILAWVSMSVAKADSSLQLDVTPVWNGYYTSGKSTEIGVRLISQRSGVVNIKVGKLLQSIELESGVPKLVGVPLFPDNANVVLLHADWQDDLRSPIEKNVSLTVSKIPNIALVTEGLTIQYRQGIIQQIHHADKDNFFSIAAFTLPRYDSGYESVDTLIIHYLGLKNLDEQQIQALSQYLSKCGKMIALEFPDSVYSKLKTIAGCNGDFLVTASSPFEFSDQIKNLIKRNPEALPDLSVLSTTVSESEGYNPYLSLVVFCFSYLLMVIMTAVITKRQYALFILPLLATVITIVIWYKQQPERYLISWLQMDSQQTSARYSAFLSMRGIGRWQEPVNLPIAAVLSKAASISGQIIHFNGEHPNVVTTDTRFSLLFSAEWDWQSSLLIDAPLKLKIENQQLIVINTSQQILQAGLLKWKGEIYPLPVLKSGQTWAPTVAISKDTSNSVLVKLMSEYSDSFTDAILIPFTPDLLQFSTKHVGWLLIHLQENVVLPKNTVKPRLFRAGM